VTIGYIEETINAVSQRKREGPRSAERLRFTLPYWVYMGIFVGIEEHK
jgi:hypothetical protein